jgi:hypothetical protein
MGEKLFMYRTHLRWRVTLPSDMRSIRHDGASDLRTSPRSAVSSSAVQSGERRCHDVVVVASSHHSGDTASEEEEEEEEEDASVAIERRARDDVDAEEGAAAEEDEDSAARRRRTRGARLAGSAAAAARTIVAARWRGRRARSLCDDDVRSRSSTAKTLRCVLYKSFSPRDRFQHLIASLFN